MRIHDRVRTGAADDLLEAPGNRCERLIPRDRLEPPLALRTNPAQRPRQTRLRVEENAVVSDRALSAESATAHRMIPVAAHVSDCAVALDNRDPARVIAITRTRRKHDGLDPTGFKPIHAGSLPPINALCHSPPCINRITRCRSRQQAGPGDRRPYRGWLPAGARYESASWETCRSSAKTRQRWEHEYDLERRGAA
jgi:hypothetical protein